VAVDAAKTFEGFGVSHAAILDPDGVVPGGMHEFGDIYGVRSATIAADSGNYDNTGDDFVLSTWYWINFATVTVEAGYVPFETIALMQGDVTTSSSVSGGVSYSVPLWSECSQNTAPRPMLVRIPAKDLDGELRTIDFILYRVHFGPISFTGPSYKSGLLLNYSGKAVLSSTDEAGNALAERAIGRLASGPYSCPFPEE
jgi:hypothetical protein